MKKTSFAIMLLLAMFALPAKAVSFSPAPGASDLVPLLAENIEDEEEEPYVEPPFTAYFDIDNPDVLYFTVNDKDYTPAESDGKLMVVVDPGDGYIKVHVIDGYAFTKFTDIDVMSGGDYMQYSGSQTMPVTVRKVKSTGYGEGESVDGHTFMVRTKDLWQVETFTLTVKVDEASKAEVLVGKSSDRYSSTNRRIILEDGENEVAYTEDDRYVHISGASWLEPLHSVVFDGDAIPDFGGFGGYYRVSLDGTNTAGKLLEIYAHEPKEDIEDNVEGIAADGKQNVKIFSLKGEYVGTTEMMQNLPTGIYIIGGCKVAVK